MIDADFILIKEEIGNRFKQFREVIGKTQSQVAKDLDVYQSTITNIEVGKTFPGVKYIHFLHRKYRLNNNWLLNDCGEIILPFEEFKGKSVSKLNFFIPEDNPRYKQYVELLDFMQIPLIENVMMAKLQELKVIAKAEIESFRKQKKANEGK